MIQVALSQAPQSTFGVGPQRLEAGLECVLPVLSLQPQGLHVGLQVELTVVPVRPQGAEGLSQRPVPALSFTGQHHPYLCSNALGVQLLCVFLFEELESAGQHQRSRPIPPGLEASSFRLSVPYLDQPPHPVRLLVQGLVLLFPNLD